MDKYIQSPGMVYKKRTEGWATTYKGAYGINAIPDISKIQAKKIVVWGDSFVEAHQVEDNEKIPQRVTQKIISKRANEDYLCFGAGKSGDSLADFYFDIQKYEKKIDNIILHVILLTDLKDSLPDQNSDKKDGVYQAIPLLLKYNIWKPKYQAIKKRLNDYGLYFVWEPTKSGIEAITQTNLFPQFNWISPRLKTNQAETNTPEKKLPDSVSWRFLFDKFKDISKAPILIVYCPDIPLLKNGNVVLEDQHLSQIHRLVPILKMNGIGFINAGPAFISLYSKSKKFPRGFQNSNPVKGHFNAMGHEIISDVIFQAIISERHIP